MFRLRPEITLGDYEQWFQDVNVPASSGMTTVSSYRVWRIVGELEGQAPFHILEEIEITNRTLYEQELEAAPAVVAMLEQWYARVTDTVIVYGEELAQTT